jgi:hypothetical protein
MKPQNLKNMKKWILSAAFVVAATLSAFANSAVIAQLKANAPAQIDCQFEQQKFLKGMAKPVVSKGALTYTKDNLSMIYTQPAGDYLHISPTEFSMQVKGKVRKHNIKPGSPMLVLKNTLTLCMDGDVEAVATENAQYNLDTFVKYHVNSEAEESVACEALLVALYDYVACAKAYVG